MIVEDERDTYSHHGYEIPDYDHVGSVEGVNVQAYTKEAVNDEGGEETTQGDNSDWTYSTVRLFCRDNVLLGVILMVTKKHNELLSIC